MTTRKPEDLTLEEVKEQMCTKDFTTTKQKTHQNMQRLFFGKETRARRTKETGRKHK